jgi:Peptide methionine sulfoxide reductase
MFLVSRAFLSVLPIGWHGSPDRLSICLSVRPSIRVSFNISFVALLLVPRLSRLRLSVCLSVLHPPSSGDAGRPTACHFVGPFIVRLPIRSWQGNRLERATFGAGCFWGPELAFQRVPGVVATAVGYSQGEGKDVSYEQVCTGTTGHVEVVQVSMGVVERSSGTVVLFWGCFRAPGHVEVVQVTSAKSCLPQYGSAAERCRGTRRIKGGNRGGMSAHWWRLSLCGEHG